MFFKLVLKSLLIIMSELMDAQNDLVKQRDNYLEYKQLKRDIQDFLDK